MSLSVAVRHRFPGFALDIAFEAPSGVTALFGRSGSGKTSVVNTVAGLLRPEAARIAVDGWRLCDTADGLWLPPSRRRMGYVFQEGRLFPHLSVRRNLTYGRWAGGRRADGRSFDEVVALLGLPALLERAPGTLSGGERQRVAIGRALLADPALLLMDEPLSALDEERRGDILPYLEKIRDETEIPILYVSHNAGEVARLADAVVLLDQGRVTAVGSAAEIFGRLDLPGTADERGMTALVTGTVVDIDTKYQTAGVAVDGARVELTGRGFTLGQVLRLRVHASDVALARAKQAGVSIRNQIACTVAETGRIEGAHVTVALAVGGQRLLSRITRKSFDEIGIREGQQVVALVKAVSVESPG